MRNNARRNACIDRFFVKLLQRLENLREKEKARARERENHATFMFRIVIISGVVSRDISGTIVTICTIKIIVCTISHYYHFLLFLYPIFIDVVQFVVKTEPSFRARQGRMLHPCLQGVIPRCPTSCGLVCMCTCVRAHATGMWRSVSLRSFVCFSWSTFLRPLAGYRPGRG